MKTLYSIALALMMVLPLAAQKQVGDVTLPETMTVGDETLGLNGAGIREKLWFDLYSGGLYLENASNNGSTIVNADEAMAIKLHITSKLISSKKMIDAVDEGFEKSTNGNTKKLQAKIDIFKSFFSDEIVKDNVFDITYQPGKGVIVYKDGTKKGAIQGLEFKKALFGIWLGSDPADEDLKMKMLGS